MLKKKQTVDIFSGFKFTGDLRPARVTPKRAMPPAIKRPDYADHPQGRSECEEGSKKFAGGVGIPIYTAEEIEGIRWANGDVV
jgi:methionyl aminopeptidase